MTCNKMRGAIMLSGAFLGVGTLLHLIGVSSSDQWGPFSLIAWYSSFALILTSPLILLFALFMTMLPGSDKRFERCNH